MNVAHTRARHQISLHFSLALPPPAHHLPAFTISAVQQRNSLQQECAFKEVTHVYVVVFVQARALALFNGAPPACASLAITPRGKVRCFYLTSWVTLCTLLKQWPVIVQIIDYGRTQQCFSGHGAFRFESHMLLLFHACPLNVITAWHPIMRHRCVCVCNINTTKFCPFSLCCLLISPKNQVKRNASFPSNASHWVSWTQFNSGVALKST